MKYVATAAGELKAYSQNTSDKGKSTIAIEAFIGKQPEGGRHNMIDWAQSKRNPALIICYTVREGVWSLDILNNWNVIGSKKAGWDRSDSDASVDANA